MLDEGVAPIDLSSAIAAGGPAAVSFENVTCTFSATSANAAYTAVRDVDLNLTDGEFLSVVGPTGCGKSTLLNLAAGLLTTSAGDVCIFGQPLQGINRDASYLFQGDALMPWYSAVDNVMAGLLFRGVSRSEARSIAVDWLARVGLSGHGERYPHEMSGGMRKRVALAQALVLDPKIILMDEPFSALDIQTRQLMEDELLEIWAANRKSVLFITHDLEEAIAMSDRVIVLSAGPGTRPIASFDIDLPRPREVADIRLSPQFNKLHNAIWTVLKDEVLKGYVQSKS